MKKWWVLLALLLTLFGQQVATANSNGPVAVVTVREDITHNTLFFLRRAMNEVIPQGAVALVMELDTNGGRVDATEEIMRLLERAPLPVYTFINHKAFSAGAFISAATDRIYMAPGSVIGAAAPVMAVPGQGPTEIPKAYEAKLNSAVRALIRSAAQQKGHNVDVFEAMVDPERGLTVAGKVIAQKGELLTLTDQEAAELYGDPPKPLLSAGTVSTVDELLEKVGLADRPRLMVEPFGFEILGRWLTAIGPLLIMIGMVAIYIEMKTPGIGVPAAVAAVCFALYFFGNFAAGLAGWEDLVLFAIGIALLLVEVLVLPGFGVTGALGVLCILLSLVLGMTQRLPGGSFMPAWPDVQVPIVKVALSFAGSLVAMGLLARWLPETALFRRIELTATSPAPPPPATQPALAVGRTGVAATRLRPAGKGDFDGQLADVETDGDWLEKGTPIRVVRVEGVRVVVTRA